MSRLAPRPIPEGYSLCLQSNGTWWAMRPDGTKAPRPHTRRGNAVEWCEIDLQRQQAREAAAALRATAKQSPKKRNRQAVAGGKDN